MKRRTFSPTEDKPAISDQNISEEEIIDPQHTNRLAQRMSRSRSFSNSAANPSTSRVGARA